MIYIFKHILSLHGLQSAIRNLHGLRFNMTGSLSHLPKLGFRFL